MMDEVRFSSYTVRGEPNLYVDLDTFIKLFVNHRPVYGIGKNNIEEAFKAIIDDEDNQDQGADNIYHDNLIRLLSDEGSAGEQIMMRELQEIMGKLVSEYDVKLAIGNSITAERFAEEVLGFEEVDENEGDEDEEADGGAGQSFAATGAADQSKLGVIQEEP